MLLVAFRDRGAGSSRNQAKSTDEAPREGARGGAGARGRGGMYTKAEMAMRLRKHPTD